MIIFMALAAGESVLRCGPLTLHTESAIHVAQQLTGAQFTVRQAASLVYTTATVFSLCR
jgi:RNA 3'-terminal phosphate cyclase (ATP)